MIIDKSVIDRLKKKNEKVAELLSEIADMQSEELLSINEEIQRIKLQRKNTLKKDNSLDKTNLKLGSSLLTFRTLVSKLESEKEIHFDIPKIAYPKSNPKQSKQDFSRKHDEGDSEKIKLLKSISKKLDFDGTYSVPDVEVPKKEDSGITSNLLSTAGLGVGAGLLLKAGKRALPFVGLAFSLKSAYDLFGTIKDGISDYKKFKDAGDNVSANNVLFKSSIGGLGNLLGIAAGFLPGPVGLLLGLASGFLEYTADNFNEIKSDKSNQIIQDQNTVAKVEYLLEQGQKNQILQLRPNVSNMGWEYKDYKSDDWTPLIDQNTGKQLSITEGKNKVIADQTGKDGIQTYKLKTDSNGLVELVFRNGVPQIKLGDSYSPISTRKDGGSVKKGNQYLVGEVGPEKYQTKPSLEINAKFSNMNSVLKKLVDRYDVEGMISKMNITSDIPFKFFEPTSSITYSKKGGQIFANNSLIKIDFSNIPKDSKSRFDEFMKQIFAEEGGYVNNANDKGKATNFGITQATLDNYNKKNSLPEEDVKDITQEKAKQIYYQEYYKKNKLDEISDPRAAYFYFDSYIHGWSKAGENRRKGNVNIDSLIDLKKQYYENIVKKDASQSVFLEGWMGRLERLKQMLGYGQKPKPVELQNLSQNLYPMPIIQPSGVDKKFMINTIAPKLAEVVSNKFGG